MHKPLCNMHDTVMHEPNVVCYHACGYLTDATGVNTDIAISSLLVTVANTVWGPMLQGDMEDIVRCFFVKRALVTSGTCETMLNFLLSLQKEMQANQKYTNIVLFFRGLCLPDPVSVFNTHIWGKRVVRSQYK